MRRLYLQIYLSFLGIAVLFGVLASAVWFGTREPPEDRHRLDRVAQLAGSLLPPQESPEALPAALDRLGETLSAHLAVWDSDRRLLARHGDPVPPPPDALAGSGMFRARGGPLAALALPDGRWLTARWMRPRRPYGLPIALGLLALAVGVGAYPLARRITGRLERLQARVEALGQGDLAARVDVEGRDEVARLAESFNHAAQRIERMVAAQRSMLASASHELRSPLARMRMGLALMEREDRPELRAQLHREIAELDELVGEILLAARLDAGAAPGQIEQVDLLGLLAEEGARIGVEPTGQAMLVHGERRLLRRMMRNLLENARRHAPIESIECSVQPGGDGGVRIEVCDRGPGVPGEERERIFEPFYRASGASEDADGGYGLGLALVRQIARRHGGEAWCVNRPGGGACFVVELAAPGPSPQRR